MKATTDAEPKGVQKTTTIGLYPKDKELVEYIREHRRLDSFGSAVRVAIREMADRLRQERVA